MMSMDNPGISMDVLVYRVVQGVLDNPGISGCSSDVLDNPGISMDVLVYRQWCPSWDIYGLF